MLSRMAHFYTQLIIVCLASAGKAGGPHLTVSWKEHQRFRIWGYRHLVSLPLYVFGKHNHALAQIKKKDEVPISKEQYQGIWGLI
jgi:hypothetical protein